MCARAGRRASTWHTYLLGHLPCVLRCPNRHISCPPLIRCLNAGDTFQLTHGAIYEPFLIKLLTKANNKGYGNCTFSEASAAAHGRRGLLVPRNLAAVDASGSESGSESGGGDTMFVPTVSEILDNLNRYRVANEYTKGHPEDDVVWIDKNNTYIHLHYSHSHTCGKDSHQYNDMAMLWLNGGVKAVKVLLQRGFPHMISASALIVFCVVRGEEKQRHALGLVPQQTVA